MKLKFFSYDSPLDRFATMFSDFIILNVLWVLCSLPLVTVGAATSALHYTAYRRLTLDDTHICRNFFRAFRRDGLQATLLWLGIVMIGLCFAADFYIAARLPGSISVLFLSVGCLLLLPFFLVVVYIFPVVSRYEQPLIRQIRTALLMALHNFPQSVVLLLTPVATILLIYFIPYVGMAIPLLPALYAYLWGRVFVRIFRRYLPEESSAVQSETD